MAYIVLARKWRPKTFEEVVGQEHITTTLKNAIKADRIAHAYLFSGSRGIGKTTMARLLAKALNCVKGPTSTPCGKCSSCQEISSGQNLDVLEIDGASNRGINEIRSLRQNVKFTPASSKYKIYIIDEIHMLTPEAFNALLKTLEEPPLHVKFIFATTQASRVPSTILSRCQRFDFRLITIKEIVEHLKKIARAEKVEIAEEALLAVARGAEGSMRDAQSILDQLISFTGKQILESDVYTLLGAVKEAVFEELTLAIAKRDTRVGLKIINNLLNEGKDLRVFINACLLHFRNLVMLKLGKDLDQLVDLSPQAIRQVETLSEQFSLEELLQIIYLFAKVEEDLKGASSAKLALEMAIIRLTELPKVSSFQEILKRLSDLERKLGGGELAETEEEEEEKAPRVTQQAPEEEKQKNSSLSLSNVAALWPEVLKDVRRQKITAAAFLAEGRPTGLTGKRLTLSFKPGCNFHKESLESSDNRRLIENVLKERLNEDLSIQYVICEEERGITQDQEPKRHSKEKSHGPLIEKMLHLFKGEIIDGE